MQKRLSFRIISILSTLVLLLNCFMVQAATPANQFSDVKESAWYYTAVKYAVENNLMNGVGGGKFDPNGAASRAMLVTLLYRMEGEPKVSVKTPFTDLKDDWYKAPIAWAYANKIVNGTSDTTFSPTTPLTREQFATIMYRYCKESLGLDVSTNAQLSGYPDHKSISDYAKTAMIWANAEGMITGSIESGKVYLRPQQTATRAQMATIFQRFDSYLEQKEEQNTPVAPPAQAPCDYSGEPNHKDGTRGMQSKHIYFCREEGCVNIKEVPCTIQVQTIPATCKEYSKSTYSCALCGYNETLINSSQPLADHKWSEKPSHKVGTSGAQSKHIYFCREDGCDGAKEVSCDLTVQTIPATCYEYSKSTYSCATCGYEETIVNSSEPLDHNWDETPSHIDGTSGTQSKHIYCCREDGCDGTQEVPCTIQVQTIPATCKENSKTTYSCALCGYEQTIVNTSEPLGEHNWSEEPSHVDGTSGTQSKHIYCCREDGCDGTQEVPCTIQVQTIPATCKENSKTTYSCATCGYKETIINSSESLGEHIWDETPAHIDGTSGAQSKHIYSCREEGCVETKEEPCSIQVQTIPATCKEYSKTTYSCATCGYEETIVNSSEPLGDHNWDETPAHIDGTIGAQSKHIYSCREEGCNATKEVPCTIQVQTTPATCKEYSKTTYSCATCGYKDTVVNSSEPLAEHNWDETPAHIDGTSGAQSKHIYSCCVEGCDATQEVPCSIQVENIPATCYEYSKTTYSCATCGYKDTIVNSSLPLAEHNWDETPAHIDGTSGAQSKHIYSCREEGCNATKEVSCTIQAQTTPATCKEYSKSTYSCATCGYEDTIVSSSQPLAEHSWNENPSHIENEEPSSHYYTCKYNCGNIKKETCNLTITKTPAEIGKDGTINYSCALCGYTHSVPDPDAPALKENAVIKLMSLNLKYDDKDDQGTDNDARIRQYRLKALVEKYDPDVIGTQEFDAFWESAMPTLFGEDYEMYFEYRDHRNPPKGSNEASAILWKKDKFELLEQGYFWLSENPNSTVPGFGLYYPRICNWVRLKDKQSGKIVRIASTHFGSYKDDDGNPDTYPVEVIRKLFEKECEKAGDEPYLFMGDFNIGYQDSPPDERYNVLTNTNKFYDLRPAAEAADKKGQCELGDIRTGTNGAYNKNNNGTRVIDYIFAGNNAPIEIQKFGYCYDRIAVPERGISKGPFSDHYAVYAEVKI